MVTIKSLSRGRAKLISLCLQTFACDSFFSSKNKTFSWKLEGYVNVKQQTESGENVEIDKLID